jgi:cytochrome b subunit of formate dehydrogenase
MTKHAALCRFVCGDAASHDQRNVDGSQHWSTVMQVFDILFSGSGLILMMSGLYYLYRVVGTNSYSPNKKILDGLDLQKRTHRVRALYVSLVSILVGGVFAFRLPLLPLYSMYIREITMTVLIITGLAGFVSALVITRSKHL